MQLSRNVLKELRRRVTDRSFFCSPSSVSGLSCSFNEDERGNYKLPWVLLSPPETEYFLLDVTISLNPFVVTTHDLQHDRCDLRGDIILRHLGFNFLNVETERWLVLQFVDCLGWGRLSNVVGGFDKHGILMRDSRWTWQLPLSKGIDHWSIAMWWPWYQCS